MPQCIFPRSMHKIHKRQIPAGARYPRNQNKSHLLRGNWLRSAKRPAISPPVGIPLVAESPPTARNQIQQIREIHRATRPSHVPKPDKGFVFSAAPDQFARIFVHSEPHVFRDPRTVMHKPKADVTCRSRITQIINSHLSKIGFLFAKRPPVSTHCAGAPIGQQPQVNRIEARQARQPSRVLTVPTVE